MGQKNIPFTTENPFWGQNYLVLVYGGDRGHWKGWAHHTSMYFHTRRPCVDLTQVPSQCPAQAGVSYNYCRQLCQIKTDPPLGTLQNYLPLRSATKQIPKGSQFIFFLRTIIFSCAFVCHPTACLSQKMTKNQKKEPTCNTRTTAVDSDENNLANKGFIFQNAWNCLPSVLIPCQSRKNDEETEKSRVCVH